MQLDAKNTRIFILEFLILCFVINDNMYIEREIEDYIRKPPHMMII